ncbi:MAG: YigZ family protein [Bacilli bacterium]
MITIETRVNISLTIKKSLFVCHLIPISDEFTAKQVLEAIKVSTPNATHHCYAYIFGPAGEHFRYYDDKEPSGTAGLIIYDVLQKNAMTNVLAVVVRDFGGIKLGSGGLIRAYRRACSDALAKANLIPYIEWTTLCFTCRYEDWPVVENRCLSFTLIDKSFTEGVSCTYRLPKAIVNETKALLINLTKNQIIWMDSSSTPL